MENKDIKKIYILISAILKNAPKEEDCSDKENEIYANMENLKESIENYIKEEN